ncbi:MAG TPA: flagellar filament capping protein FliD [Rudaea sp.]
MTSISSSGTISSAGIGSGLDVNSLVSQLVAAERAPQDKQLGKATSTIGSQLSAYKAIQSTLGNLQTALKALQGTTGAFSGNTATSSDTTIFTATTETNAAQGNYAIEVKSLATAQKLASSGYATSATTVGTGRLSIGSGANAFNVDLDSSNNTLSGLRDAINNASANTSVTASLITADDGVHLVLTARNTGTSNAITVTTSGGDGALANLVYDPAHANQHLSQLSAAGDAVLSVEGYTYTSASNQVSGTVAGVTLNLAAAKPGTTLTLTVGHDNSGIAKALQTLVSAYNAFENTINNTTAYNASTQTASALTGDSLARSAEQQIRNALIAVTPGKSGGVRSMFDLGISTNDNGTLSFDSSKLNTALASDFGSASKLFATDGAVGSALQTALNGFVGTGGVLDSRTTSLNKRLDDISKQRTTLDSRMAALTARYTAQYSALDSLMAQMNQTSTFLTNQFNKSNSNS